MKNNNSYKWRAIDFTMNAIKVHRKVRLYAEPGNEYSSKPQFDSFVVECHDRKTIFKPIGLIKKITSTATKVNAGNYVLMERVESFRGRSESDDENPLVKITASPFFVTKEEDKVNERLYQRARKTAEKLAIDRKIKYLYDAVQEPFVTEETKKFLKDLQHYDQESRLVNILAR